MSSLTFAVFMALCGGLAVAVQGPLASLVGREVGTLGSGLVVHASGALIAVVLLLFTGWHSLAGWSQIPWYALVGTGLCGVIVIAAFSLSVPLIGMTGTASLIVASQLIAAAVFDHFGLLGLEHYALSWVRIAGMGVLLLGAWMILR